MSEQTNFALVRIIGNELYPRSERGSTVKNLRYIIENEYPFENCDKVYLINRIVDPDFQRELVDLMEQTRSLYILNQIDWDHYGKLDCHGRFNYVVAPNTGRNFCLKSFKDTHEVVLPLDGNCFFRLDGWMRLVSSVEEGKGYIAIQNSRCVEYPELTGAAVQTWFETYYHNGLVIQGASEPQVGFISKEYDLNFDESINYSETSKIDLLFSIGLRGVWDQMYPITHAKTLLKAKSKFYGKSCQGGWCYRLPTGSPEVEKDNRKRAELRTEAIRGLLQHADRVHSSQ
jgi:hypothetical protein